ncbi:MAG: SMP-30/gluconolactonase/LRE family protein [Cellvibrionaceae bacterium]|nr:SMP-30/gluconolactonase/LRE family protein [Cellvibrionaceae bacterium]
MQNILSTVKLTQGNHGQPVWIDLEGSLFWVDDAHQRLYQYHEARAELSNCSLDAPVLNISPRINHGFIATLQDGIGFFDLKERKVTYISKPEPFSSNQAIGGITDKSGNYWSFTQRKDGSSKQANLYQITPHMEMQKYSNAQWLGTTPPIFSKDGLTLYQSSSTTRYIYCTHLNENGKPVVTDTLCRISKTEGAPHGLCVDSEDNIWVCHRGIGLMSCYNKKGKCIEKIRIDAPGADYCCFGGKDLSTLFVITAKENKLNPQQDEPTANSLITLKPGVSGLRADHFAC